MLTKDEIFQKIQHVLSTTFEIEETRLTPTAHLFTDLDLDSIDAIDLTVELEKNLGLKLKEEELRQIRTIQDVVDTIHRLLQNRP